MYKMLVTEKQLQMLTRVLDTELRSNGIGSLSLVVELNNLLVEAARRGQINEKEEQEETKQDS